MPRTLARMSAGSGFAASSDLSGDMFTGEGLGSEFSWLMATAKSWLSKSSKEILWLLGRSSRSSTWLRSQLPFCRD